MNKILDFLVNNCVGEENAIGGAALAAIFNLKEGALRSRIKKLRVNQNIIIGASKKGYYIPREEEHLKAVRYAENKVISHLETTIKQRPSFIFEVYKMLNEIKKTLPEAVHGAIRFDDEGNFVVDDLYAEKLPFE